MCVSAGPNVGIYMHHSARTTVFPRLVQVVERYSKPEVEIQDSPELLLDPVTVCRNAHERFFVEPSINSVRISLKARHSSTQQQFLACACVAKLANVVWQGSRCARGMR